MLITGDTGFKGSWLSLWLSKMGAEVIGYSQGIPSEPSHIGLLKIKMKSVVGDVLDKEKLLATIETYKPDIIFHMAAQPIVRLSYTAPVETLEVNIMGTVNVLESVRKVKSVKAVVVITSDKCYENREQIWGYREGDAMGGDDPYSASKGCAELVTASYKKSFFNPKEFEKSHNTLIATVRAGNVIGGGDWANDRLIPDIMRAASKGEKVMIRNPYSTRPWQHVIDPLSGYLLLGSKLLEGNLEFSDAFNFGPSEEGSLSVKDVIEDAQKYWDKIGYVTEKNVAQPHEAHLLKVDSTKAHMKLKWKSVWDSHTTFKKTALWYKNFYENKKVLSEDDLDAYIDDARKATIIWTVKS